MTATESIKTDLNAIRSESPLVHNITNYVVMNNTANALLAIGASPVMAHAIDEVEDMVNIASALVLNIGTLSGSWIEAMIKAGKAAKSRSIPVIFDPVGAGATAYRTKTCERILMECAPDVIRGNASEIIALVEEKVNTKGVDSTDSSHAAIEAAKILSQKTKAVVVISGSTDYLIDKQSVEEVCFGSPLMGKVTGMGCTATAIIGAFAAINKNYHQASTHAMTVMGIAGELAAKQSAGPGTMQMHFLDTLYQLTAKDIDNHINPTADGEF